MLLLVGSLNLRALLGRQEYRPVGWRQWLVPRVLRKTSHPMAIIMIGMIFGLVFDTATQAAAWGTAASAGGGVPGALLIAAVFAAGMLLADTADSQIVARLLRSRGDPTRVRHYRRGVGWLIVALSFSMAGFTLVELLSVDLGLTDTLFTMLGATAALMVIAALLLARMRQRTA